MSLQLAERLRDLKPSATLALVAQAAELKRQGHPVINLSAGEPDFDTPNVAKDAAMEAIRQGQTKYTEVEGILALRQWLADHYTQRFSFAVKPTGVIVSTGAKQALFNAFLALLNAGDEVIIPAPYWVSYPEMVKVAGGTPILLPTQAEQSFCLEADVLRKAITSRTKALVLCSPSNPTGTVYQKAQLHALAEVLREHPHIVVISDDIYEALYYDAAVPHILEVAPDLAEQTLIINGVSKAYAMTGWRIGYAVGPEALIKGMKTLQGQSTSNPCSIAQAAALAALRSGLQDVEPMRQAFDKRRVLFCEALNQISGIQCPLPQGSFYVFAHVQDLIASLGLEDDLALSQQLLAHTHVAAVPGSAFGAPGYLRLSFALSEADLLEAAQRIQAWVTQQLS